MPNTSTSRGATFVRFRLELRDGRAVQTVVFPDGHSEPGFDEKYEVYRDRITFGGDHGPPDTARWRLDGDELSFSELRRTIRRDTSCGSRTPGSGWTGSAQEGEDRDDAAVRGGRVVDAELEEDLSDVALDGLGAEEEPLGRSRGWNVPRPSARAPRARVR